MTESVSISFLFWFTGMRCQNNCEKPTNVDSSDRTGSIQNLERINGEPEFMNGDRFSISPVLKAHQRSSVSPEAEMVSSAEDMN
jgi:hypothetical protein